MSVCLSVCPSVCLSGTSLSKTLNLHLSLIVLSQICLRSVSGQSQVRLRSLSLRLVCHVIAVAVQILGRHNQHLLLAQLASLHAKDLVKEQVGRLLVMMTIGSWS